MMVVKMSDKEGYFQYVLFTAHGEVLLIFFSYLYVVGEWKVHNLLHN